MTALTSKANISGSPSRATANAGFGDLWEFIDERMATGDATAAEKAATRAALETARDLQPITASVGSNALTLTLNPTNLDFRSATIGSGTVNTRTVSAAINVVISSGSTLGTSSGVANRIAVLAIDNAGTVELAAVNADGGFHFDETQLISTTAEGGAGAADGAATVYSTSARSNVPFRIVGYIESTQATAGTWATEPSKKQGAGGGASAKLVHHAPGDPPMFSVRAWGNMNGTGTIALNASGNVASITDLGTGNYRVTFTTAMPHDDYGVFIQAKDDGTARVDTNPANKTTSQFEFTVTRTGTSTVTDSPDISFFVVC